VKKFIVKSTFFIIGFYLLAFMIQSVLMVAIRHINVGDYGVLNKIVDGKINAEILISGTSRAFRGLNPLVISDMTHKSCFNIAADGVNLEIQLPKLKGYLNHNKKPLVIVQDVSPFGGRISKTIYEPYKYIPYLKDKEIYKGLLNIDHNFWIHKYFYPANLLYFNFDFYVSFIREILLSIKGKDRLLNGHLPDKSKWATDLEKLKRDKQGGIECRVCNEHDNYIDELIDLCKTRNIKLVFVCMPHYYEIYKIAKEKEELTYYYRNKALKKDVYFFDYSNSFLSKNINCFYNFNHMNDVGSEAFSKLISKDLQTVLQGE